MFYDYGKRIKGMMPVMSGRVLAILFFVAVWLFSAVPASAAILNEPMTNATAPGWVIGGNAYLTASTGVDQPGYGWLRLTEPSTYEVGYAYYDTSFDISQGAVIQYDYATWGGNGADGYSIYLFDASYSFSIGATGGSLGYANRTGYNGMAGGYIGIGVDEFGNFSSTSEGKSGGIGGGLYANAIGVRGPASTYAYLGGSGILAQALAFSGQAYRPDQSGAQYRKVVIYLTPVAAPNYLRIDAYVQFGAGQALTQVVNGLYTGQVVPASVKVGYAASTGGQTNYHEIRNLVVSSLPNNVDLSMTKTVNSPTVAPGGTVTYTLTARNLGPSGTTATGATITDDLSVLSGVTWNCPGASPASGNNSLSTTATIPFNGAVTCTITGTAPAGTGTVISNTATVTAPTGLTDYNPANNSSTVSTVVTSGNISVSGTVFNDANHDGSMDNGETGANTGNTYYAKIFRSNNLSTAVAVATVNAATGAYTFNNNVPAYGTYTIILSSTNTATAFDPSFPNGNWIYTQPVNYTLTDVKASGAPLSNQNLGIYNGTRISGKVINDNGVNGPISNAYDGILNAAETGIGGVTVTLRNDANTATYDTSVTDADGDFTLFTNIGGTTLRIYETNLSGYTSVSYNAGTTAGAYTIGGEYLRFTYAQYTDYSGVIFGDVPNITASFTPTPRSAGGTPAAPVYYAHTFTATGRGTVAFTANSRTQAGWPAVTYVLDSNCSGSFDAGEPDITAPVSVEANTNICVLARVTIPSGTAPGTIDTLVTRATFTAGLAASQTNDVTDTTTVANYPNLNTSTKAWIDPTGGGQNPGDTLQYTITLTESNGAAASGVSLSDTIDTANLTWVSVLNCPSGATCGYNAGVLSVTGINLAANGSVSIVYSVAINGGVATGTTINNTAAVTIPGYPVLNVVAPPVTVSAAPAATGNKLLYLYGGAATPYRMSRTPTPGTPTTAAIAARGGSAVWNGSTPVTLQLNDTITAASATLYINASDNNTRNVEVRLSCSSNTAVYASWGPANLPTNPPVPPAAPTAYNFNLTTGTGGLAFPATCNATNFWVLRVYNRTTTTGRTITVVPVSGGDRSAVNLASSNVIDVNSVTAYDLGGTTPATFGGGDTVILRAVVSDPFGSFDINPNPPATLPTIAIRDANNNLIGTYAMSEVANSGAATKTFEYRYTVPAAGPAGFWTATVTAFEGTEGTVSDSRVGTFDVLLLPLLTVLKEVSTDGGASFTPAGVNPHGTLTYRITVKNTGTGSATNVVMVDPLPAYTTYVAGSARRATGATVIYANAPTALTDLNAADDGYDFGVTTPGTVTYNAGAIAPGDANWVQLFYQVTVN